MLTKDISDRISQCLVHTIRPEKIYVFGSYATGLANHDSDIDIMAIVNDRQTADRALSVKCRVALRKALKGLDLAFDFIVENQANFERYRILNGTIQSAVDQTGIVIYEH